MEGRATLSRMAQTHAASLVFMRTLLVALAGLPLWASIFRMGMTIGRRLRGFVIIRFLALAPRPRAPRTKGRGKPRQLPEPEVGHPTIAGPAVGGTPEIEAETEHYREAAKPGGHFALGFRHLPALAELKSVTLLQRAAVAGLFSFSPVIPVPGRAEVSGTKGRGVRSPFQIPRVPLKAAKEEVEAREVLRERRSTSPFIEPTKEETRPQDVATPFPAPSEGTAAATPSIPLPFVTHEERRAVLPPQLVLFGPLWRSTLAPRSLLAFTSHMAHAGSTIAWSEAPTLELEHTVASAGAAGPPSVRARIPSSVSHAAPSSPASVRKPVAEPSHGLGTSRKPIERSSLGERARAKWVFPVLRLPSSLAASMAFSLLPTLFSTGEAWPLPSLLPGSVSLALSWLDEGTATLWEAGMTGALGGRRPSNVPHRVQETTAPSAKPSLHVVGPTRRFRAFAHVVGEVPSSEEGMQEVVAELAAEAPSYLLRKPGRPAEPSAPEREELKRSPWAKQLAVERAPSITKIKPPVARAMPAHDEEAELRELERKLTKILAEEVRWYYGSDLD